MSTKLTRAQLDTAMLIQAIRKQPGIPTAWLQLSTVMALVEIESGFDPSIKASDFKKTGSVGLMQVTTATLDNVVRTAWPRVTIGPQTDPRSSLTAGMLTLWADTRYLAAHLYQHGTVPLEATIQAYNSGAGAIARGGHNPRYLMKWQSARQKYLFLDAAPC